MLSSWSYDGAQLKLESLGNVSTLLEYYIENAEWDIVEHKHRVHTKLRGRRARGARLQGVRMLSHTLLRPHILFCVASQSDILSNVADCTKRLHHNCYGHRLLHATLK
jgi:hypothetical protein